MVHDMHFPEVVQQIRNNKAAFLPLHHPRYINNIYLDTNDMDFFTDNVSGKRKPKEKHAYDGMEI